MVNRSELLNDPVFFEKSIFNSLTDMMTMCLFSHGCPATGRHNPCLMSVAQVLELLFPISDIQHKMQYKCLGFSVIPVCIYIINTWFAGCVRVWQHSFITVGEQPQMQRICIQSDLMAYAFSLVFEYLLLSVVKISLSYIPSSAHDATHKKNQKSFEI